MFVSAGYQRAPWKVDVVYHDFSAEDGGADYGSEIDASVGYRFAKRYGVLVKAARFDADGPGFADTTKFWLMLSAGF